MCWGWVVSALKVYRQLTFDFLAWIILVYWMVDLWTHAFWTFSILVNQVIWEAHVNLKFRLGWRWFLVLEWHCIYCMHPCNFLSAGRVWCLMFVPMVAIFQCQDFHALQLDLHILWFDLTGLGYFVGVEFPTKFLEEACKMRKECVSNLCTVTAWG